MANRSPRSFISRRWWVRTRRTGFAPSAAGPVPYGAVVSLMECLHMRRSRGSLVESPDQLSG